MTTRDVLPQAYDRTRGWILEEPPAHYRYDRIGPLTRVVGQHRGFIDPAPDLGIEGPALADLIAQQRDFFAARGEGVEWKTRSHDRPAEVVSYLLAAGFTPEPSETVMIGVSRLMAADPVLPVGFTLRQVSDQVDLERIAAMESQVWGADLSWIADYLGSRIQAAPDEIAVLIAQAGDEVVSAAALIFKPGTDFGMLIAGSTLPACGGRGIYRALLARRAQLAMARDVSYLQVDASDNSRPILRRLGFQAVTTTTPYVFQPVG